MTLLSDNKLKILQGGLKSNEDYWYITKQECNFTNLCYIAEILSRWDPSSPINYEEFFNSTKITPEFSKFVGKTAHRATINLVPYGLKYDAKGYDPTDLSSVFHRIKELTNSHYENTVVYQNIIDDQIEKIFIQTSSITIYPMMFTFKILLNLGDITGEYSITKDEFKTFVATAHQWNEYFMCIESIIRYRNDAEYRRKINQSDGKKLAGDTRFNLVIANHDLVSVEDNKIYIPKEKVNDVRLKLAKFELSNPTEIDPEVAYSRLSSNTVPTSQQVIYFGAPGTGKSHEIKGEIKGHPHYRITFHPDTDYASFVGSYKPISVKGTLHAKIGGTEMVLKDDDGNNMNDTKIVYRYVFQAFLKAYVRAWEELTKYSPENVFLVIEEINRGNCAQIFGDIFQLLDRNDEGFSDYPIVADDDLKQELSQVLGTLDIKNADYINSLYPGQGDIVTQIKSGDILLLPNNLFIRATMNTSDQSLFPIDSAFKRRWDWRYVNIKNHEEENYSISFSNGNKYSWWDFLDKINSEIEGGDIQQEDKKLGYFFTKAKNREILAETFLSKVLFFLYNDVFKDFGIDQYFFKDETDKAMTFASYFDHEGKIIESRVEQVLKNLRVKLTSEIEVDNDDDFLEDESNSSNGTQSWFSVNEEEWTNMIDTVLSVLQKYFEANPSVTTVKAIEDWNSFGLPKHALETEKEFNEREDKTKERASKIWNSPDGRKFYVSTQLRPKHMEKLIKKAAEWGIEVKRISE